MRAICVDDNAQVLEHIVDSVKGLQLLEDVRGFTHPEDALEWMRDNDVQLILLDIDMPNMNGLELARRMRNIAAKTPIIFITAYSKFALDAFDVHPTGYLLKPFDRERLAREVAYALSDDGVKPPTRIVVHTFGHFDILVNGNNVIFRRSKSKELLAYLIHRHGASISRREAFGVLWNDRNYDLSMQKQMDVVIRSLRETLKQYDADSIFELKSRNLFVLPDRFECDLYRALAGDGEVLKNYFGEYMTQYSWAAQTRERLSQLQAATPYK